MDGYNVCAAARECAIVYVRAIERNVNSPRLPGRQGARAGDRGTRRAAWFLLARTLSPRVPRALLRYGHAAKCAEKREIDPRDDPVSRVSIPSRVDDQRRIARDRAPAFAGGGGSGSAGLRSAALPEDRGFYPARTKVRKCSGKGETAQTTARFRATASLVGTLRKSRRLVNYTDNKNDAERQVRKKIEEGTGGEGGCDVNYYVWPRAINNARRSR